MVTPTVMMKKNKSMKQSLSLIWIPKYRSNMSKRMNICSPESTMRSLSTYSKLSAIRLKAKAMNRKRKKMKKLKMQMMMENRMTKRLCQRKRGK